MLKTSNIHIKIEQDIKNNTEIIFKKLGITTSQAINMFFNRVILEQGLPFSLKIPRKKMTDTEYLSSIPGMVEKITQGMKEPLENCKDFSWVD
jgi:addiction module RelB/DinJ family antitoxin